MDPRSERTHAPRLIAADPRVREHDPLCSLAIPFGTRSALAALALDLVSLTVPMRYKGGRRIRRRSGHVRACVAAEASRRDVWRPSVYLTTGLMAEIIAFLGILLGDGL